MASHKLETVWEILFDDGMIRELEFKSCYYFSDQKQKYLTLWMESLIKEENITSKPVEIREKYKVYETEPYQIVIGL